MYLLNAFSLQMVAESEGTIRFKEIPAPSRDELMALDSAIGHADTANVLGVPMNRVSVLLRKGDKAVVAQLVGGRLPEGATTLPRGFSFKFFMVEVL